MSNTTKGSKQAAGDRRLFASEPWEQCRKDLLRSLGNRSGSKASPYQYDRILRRFFGRDPKRTPDTYSRQEVEAFIHAPTQGVRASGTPPKAETYNCRLKCLKSFYKYAASYAIPFRGSIRPLLRSIDPTHGILFAKPAKSPRTLSDAEVEAIFAVIPRDTVAGLRDRALLLSYFWTGRRRAEIARLLWRDLELDCKFDDGHDGVRYHWLGKGKGQQVDSAELPEPAWTAIRVYLEASGRWKHMQPNDPLFVSLAYNARPKPLNPNSINAMFRRYLRAAGIDNDNGRLGIHSWRHNAAFIRYKEDKDLVKLQHFLRHSDPKDTLRYIEEWERQPDTTAARLYQKYGHL